MSFRFLHSILRQVSGRCPIVLLRAATWTVALGLTVAIASLAPEMAFVSAISPSSCDENGVVGIPILEFPTEVVCLPAHMVRRSKLEFLVPTIFAALVVAGSALLVRSLALWEDSGTDDLIN